MRIRNINPLGAVDVPLLGLVVEVGDLVEVTDEQAELLLAQPGNWEAVPVAEEPEEAPDTEAPTDPTDSEE